MRSVDINVENFAFAFEITISSLHPNNKIYIMGDFNINLQDCNNAAPIENFLNQIIFRIVFPCNNGENAALWQIAFSVTR